jgi:hypothetical protein
VGVVGVVVVVVDVVVVVPGVVVVVGIVAVEESIDATYKWFKKQSI